MAEAQTVADTQRGLPKVREGIVVSDKMEKTVVVAITRKIRHPEYKKFVRKTKRYIVHDKDNQCSVGDVVKIIETRPLSKKKRWRVQSIVTKAIKV